MVYLVLFSQYIMKPLLLRAKCKLKLSARVKSLLSHRYSSYVQSALVLVVITIFLIVDTAGDRYRKSYHEQSTFTLNWRDKVCPALVIKRSFNKEINFTFFEYGTKEFLWEFLEIFFK